MNQTNMAIGNLESDKRGSGARANTGKVDWSLLPIHLLAGTARVLMCGTYKYRGWNWAKGMKWSACVGCLVRHFIKWWFLREDYDDETGEHHLDHIMCNILFLRHYDLVYKEGDDRPPESAFFNTPEVWEFVNRMFDEDAYFERNPQVKEAYAERLAKEEMVAKHEHQCALMEQELRLKAEQQQHMNDVRGMLTQQRPMMSDTERAVQEHLAQRFEDQK